MSVSDLIVFVLSSYIALSHLPGFEDTGIVLEEIGQGTALEKAGLKPGDLVVHWKRNPSPSDSFKRAEGGLQSPFDWMQLVIEEAPRGPLQIKALRGAQAFSFTVDPSSWDSRVRPQLPAQILDLYQEGIRLTEVGQPEAGVALLQDAAAQAKTTALQCWLQFRIGEIWTQKRVHPRAHSAYQTALDTCRSPWERTSVWDAIGSELEQENRFVEAEAFYQLALETRKKAGEDNLGVAKSLANISRCAWSRTQIDRVDILDRQVLEIRERLAPESLDVARSLSNLGANALARLQLTEAEEYFSRSLEISRRLAPRGHSTAVALANLGIIASNRGDSDLAILYQEQSLDIRQSISPDSLLVASSLATIGGALFDKRRLEEAEETFKRALKITDRLNPTGSLAGTLFENLGLIYIYRGDLDQADQYLQRAATLKKALNPNGLGMISITNQMGHLESARGNLEAAQKYFADSLVIARENGKNSLWEARALSHLALVAQRSNNLDLAEDLHRQALRIRDVLAPHTLDRSTSLFNLASIVALKGKAQEAENLYRKALAIDEKLAPETDVIAETYYSLGNLLRKEGRLDEAENLLSRALDALEAQILTLGGTQEIKSTFHEANAYAYRALIEILLDQNRPLEAFRTLERSRGRFLLKMLEERQSAYPIADLLRHQRLASKPLNFQDAQKALDPGTLVISFSVGKENTDVFAYSATGALRIHRAHIGSKELQRSVESLRQLLELAHGGSSLSEHRARVFEATSKSLYTLLIKTLEDLIVQNDRILIVPDGSLHLLPWGALIRSKEALSDAAQPHQYLAEWKPLHTTLSTTVFGELKRLRNLNRTAPRFLLAAFGDPVYHLTDENPKGENPKQRIRSTVKQGFDFQPLPATRREVEMITGLFPGNSTAYLGIAATEENARSIPPETQLVHFSTHAFFDEIAPLNSAVVLSISEPSASEGENGLLQAWEIFEGVRLDANLVVLSACESGLGKERGGEGLIGLTRAFQYAGARSVMASLWKISDRTTAELMVRFYRHLKEGKPKDEALRAAQMELIRGPIQVTNEKGEVEEIDASAPYYWAAFQIYGDWQ